MKVWIAYMIIFMVTLSVHGQYTMSDHSTALQVHSNEEMGTLLKEAANIFHDKLNVYRKTHSAKQLKEMNQIWLMAFNHCLWMREHQNLSHSERKGTKYYTGTSLSQRLSFVQASAKFGKLGENIAFTEFRNSSDMDAEKLAERFFDMWKKSSGHRKNMLDKSFTNHSVVILKSGIRYYAVSVFYANP